MDNEIRPVEIKDLNKTQLIWLAVLLSFVVSIATGIVTVTLMQQAPTGVTQTINRVVQQTVEKVVPGYTPTTTQTVIVKEDDLVADAVSTARAITGTLLLKKDSSEPIDDVYALGGNSFLVGDATIDKSQSYYIKTTSGVYPASVTGVSPLGFSLLTAPDMPAAKKDSPKAVFANESEIKVGQTAVIVTLSAVRKGIIQSIQKGTGTQGVDWNEIILDPQVSQNLSGAVAVNLDGSILGLVVSEGDYGTAIIGADAITKFVANPAVPTTPVVSPPVPATTP